MGIHEYSSWNNFMLFYLKMLTTVHKQSFIHAIFSFGLKFCIFNCQIEEALHNEKHLGNTGVYYAVSTHGCFMWPYLILENFTLSS